MNTGHSKLQTAVHTLVLCQEGTKFYKKKTKKKEKKVYAMNYLRYLLMLKINPVALIRCLIIIQVPSPAASCFKDQFFFFFIFHNISTSLCWQRMNLTICPCVDHLGDGGSMAWKKSGDGSDGVGVATVGRIFLSTDKKRLEPPKLSMDFIYSEALFSIMNASSSSRTMSSMHGL